MRLLAIIGLTIVITACAGESPTAAVPERPFVIAAEHLETGDCLNRLPGTTEIIVDVEASAYVAYVQVVPCDDEWVYQVVRTFEVDDDGPLVPTNDYFHQQAQGNCPPAFDYYMTPSAESWLLGDRTITCFAARISGADTLSPRQ